MYKKVYIEITNNCNLDCDFCIKNKRNKKFMSTSEYRKVLKNIKPYTKYVYLHLMGEPLLHPKINEIIDMTSKEGINVNITTNGYLLKVIEKNQNIRQINISLHSFDKKYNISLRDYLDNIFNIVKFMPNTIINYRLWASNKHYDEIIKILEEKYQKKIVPNDIGNFTLDKNIFISIKKEFKWPEVKQSRIESNIFTRGTGTCLALKDHIGILSNLDVVACCLDSNGDINFGNLNDMTLEEIINSNKFKCIKSNLENNIKTEALCINCTFYEK